MTGGIFGRLVFFCLYSFPFLLFLLRMWIRHLGHEAVDTSAAGRRQGYWGHVELLHQPWIAYGDLPVTCRKHTFIQLSQYYWGFLLTATKRISPLTYYLTVMKIEFDKTYKGLLPFLVKRIKRLDEWLATLHQCSMQECSFPLTWERAGVSLSFEITFKNIPFQLQVLQISRRFKHNSLKWLL